MVEQGDLVYCRIEWPGTSPFYTVQEVLEVNPRGTTTHICTIGNPDNATPNNQNSVAARRVVEMEDIPKGKADAYRIAQVVAETKNRLNEEKGRDILETLQMLKDLSP